LRCETASIHSWST